jgi:hypothetical protein
MRAPHSTNTPDGNPLREEKDAVVAPKDPSSPPSPDRPPVALSEKRDYDYDRTLRGHTGPVRAVVTLSDGRVVTAGDDTHVVVWRSMTTQEYALARHEVEAAHKASLPPDASLHFWKYQDAFDELLRSGWCRLSCKVTPRRLRVLRPCPTDDWLREGPMARSVCGVKKSVNHRGALNSCWDTRERSRVSTLLTRARSYLVRPMGL